MYLKLVGMVGNAPTWPCLQNRYLTFRLHSENGQNGESWTHVMLDPQSSALTKLGDILNKLVAPWGNDPPSTA